LRKSSSRRLLIKILIRFKVPNNIPPGLPLEEGSKFKDWDDQQCQIFLEVVSDLFGEYPDETKVVFLPGMNF